MFTQKELLNHMLALIEKDEVANTLILALKHKYYCVYKHCLNVSIGAYLLANKMEYSSDKCIKMALGGIFHDIGKLNIPSQLLYKPGFLTHTERLMVERHPILGVNLFNGSKYFNDVYELILYHHERLDGKGYCKGLKEINIPIECKIISICDSFDAMISHRTYKKALSLEDAKKELIRNKGTQFDGILVDKFLEIVDDFYNKYYYSEEPLYINSLNEGDFNDEAVNWEFILSNLPDVGVVLIDEYDKIKFCNKIAANFRDKKEMDIIGTNFSDFHKKHRQDVIKQRIHKVKTGEIHGWERVMKRKDKYLQNKYIAIRDKNHNYEGLLLLTKDITEQENILRLLERNFENLNILVQANNLLTEVYNLKETLDKSYELFNKIIKIDYMNIVINRYKDIEYYEVTNMNGFEESVKRYICENMNDFFNKESFDMDFKIIDEKILISILLKFKNTNMGVIYIEADIKTRIEEREKNLLKEISKYTNCAIQKYLLFIEVQEKAIKDNLTGIYNRQYFQTVIGSLNTKDESIGVIMIDINNLKHINDNFGHINGDLIIKTTAQILRKSIRKVDFVFRYGGDEFIIIVRNCKCEDIKSILNRINDNIKKIWDQAKANIKLTLSMGYTISSEEKSICDIIKEADEDMYVQKKLFKKLNSVV